MRLCHGAPAVRDADAPVARDTGVPAARETNLPVVRETNLPVVRETRLPRRHGFGIGRRLFLAFGAVAGLTVLACAVALVSYNDVGATLRGITEDNLPAMGLSLRLAKSSAEVVSAAPAVLAAVDVRQRDSAMKTLAAGQSSLGQVIDALTATPGGQAATAGLRQTAAKLHDNLDQLGAAVGRRLALRDQRIAQVRAIRAIDDALDKKLAPLIDDASFNLVILLQGATDAPDAKAIQQRISDIADKQLGAFQAMLELRADCNLALGLLGEAANIPERDLLPPVRDRFTAAAGRIGKALDALKGTSAHAASGRGAATGAAYLAQRLPVGRLAEPRTPAGWVGWSPTCCAIAATQATCSICAARSWRRPLPAKRFWRRTGSWPMHSRRRWRHWWSTMNVPPGRPPPTPGRRSRAAACC